MNLNDTMGHDMVVGDFVTLAPGVYISEHVTLTGGRSPGTGAVVIQGESVVAWSVIGAGAVAVNDLGPGVTAVGIPAGVIKTRTPGWHDP